MLATGKSDSLQPCSDLTYWFVERGPNNELRLNASGAFYFFGNFVRLAIVLAAALCFIAASASVIAQGLKISPRGTDDYDIVEVRQTLYSFSIMELWTKGLYFILNIHGKVWKASCLVGDLNIKTAGVLVIIVGFIILTIPRNFVEYRLWRNLRERARIAPEEGLPDLRGEQINLAYSLLATVFFVAVAAMALAVGLGTFDLWELWRLIEAIFLN